jgi:hypothetical protein
MIIFVFIEKWDLKWFPHVPGEPDKYLEETANDELKLDDKGRVQMGVFTDCDDAKVYNFCST